MSGPEHNPTPLDYRPPREDRPRENLFVGQCVAAALGTVVLAPVVVVGGAIFAGAVVGDSSRGQGNAIGAALTVGGVILVGFIAGAVYLLRKNRWRGFGLGMLIGLGVDLLLIGLCFGAVLR